MTDTTAEEVRSLFQKLKTEHPGDFITVAEIRNAVLEEAAKVAEEGSVPGIYDGEREIARCDARADVAREIRSLKSGDTK